MSKKMEELFGTVKDFDPRKIYKGIITAVNEVAAKDVYIGKELKFPNRKVWLVSIEIPELQIKEINIPIGIPIDARSLLNENANAKKFRMRYGKFPDDAVGETVDLQYKKVENRGFFQIVF